MTTLRRRFQTEIGSLPKDADVWILAGQSNMEGCGYLAGASRPDPRVRCFTMDGHRWEVARDPLHPLALSLAPVDLTLRTAVTPAEIADQGPEAVRRYWVKRSCGTGAGLGLAFGTAYAQATGRPVGLIPAAHGGTSLEQWNPKRKGEGLGSLYGAMLERLRLSGGSARLRGILWYQGESDATAAEAPTYATRFAKWIAAVRRDTGKPRLPVIAVQIGCVADANRETGPWGQIREAQLEMPLRVPHTAVAASIDLGLHDAIHIDTAGLRRLGRRMARLALGLEKGKKTEADGPRFEKLSVRTIENDRAETDLFFRNVSGGWKADAAGRITGFSILDRKGKPHAKNIVTAAFPHPKKQNGIVVRTAALPQPGDRIAYGASLYPICNAVDEADMALPAFTATVGRGK